MPRSHRAALLATACEIALVTLALDVFVQAASFLAFVAPELSRSEAILFALRSPLLLLEHALVAGVLSLAFVPLARARWVYLVLLVLAQAWLLVDQGAYRLFFRRFHPSMLEVGAPELLRVAMAQPAELIAEQGATLIVGLGALAAYTFACARILRREPPRTFAWRPRWAAFAAVYAAAALAVTATTENFELDRHPLLSLARAWAQPAPATVAHTQGAPVESLLRYGTNEDDYDAGAEAALATLGPLAGSGKPNVVLIVLESVGGRQLLPGGLPDPAVTPFLAELSASSILFDTLYVPFPGSTRSHVALMTGGPTVTTSSVYERLAQKYSGPTLVSALAGAGYQTALLAASDLAFQRLESFYRQLGLDHLRYHDDGTRLYPSTEEVSAWGVHEQALRRVATEWLDDKRDRARPFFLALHTITTHYPYDAPGGTREGRYLDQSNEIAGEGPASEDISELHARYRHALSYTDGVLRDLFADMDARGLLDNTLFFLVGDHGQAFGETHRFNMAHLGRLYDENIASFLMIAAPGRIDGPIRPRRVAAAADLLPTIVAATGTDVPQVQGTNLLAPRWQQRIAFFHKLTPPAQCGLRDGRWKFIGEETGARAELYDLAADPTEQNDLSSSFRERMGEYLTMCRQWMADTDASFVSQLEGSPAPSPWRYGDRPPGAQSLFFGTFGKDRNVVRGRRFRAGSPVAAISHWSPYPEAKEVRFEIRAPSGAIEQRNATLAARATEALVVIPSVDEIGWWAVAVHLGNERVLEESFEVVAKEPVP